MLASGRKLFGNEPEPCSKMTARFELHVRASKRCNGCRAQVGNAWYRRRSRGDIVGCSDRLDLSTQSQQASLNRSISLPLLLQEFAHRSRQNIGIVRQNVRHVAHEMRWACADSQAVFQQEGTRLIDDGSLRANQTLPNSVKCLQIELRFGLGLRKTHRRAGNCLGYRFRIDDIRLVGLDERFDELRRHNSNRMPFNQLLPVQASMPMIVGDARARNSSSRSRLNRPLKTGLPLSSRPTTVENGLPNIDANSGDCSLSKLTHDTPQ
ncbi:hypothetical protein PCE31107_02784 [Pandoraea cepalis]|uniref:Uncharacterized protein n=1 Tax=Pandoraea cepalis TaxID=2508294 RepID=A0A5E4VR81_9BURK|nr:hypothetical protein PCE31107_02784 [Pandoraea cepalis]